MFVKIITSSSTVVRQCHAYTIERSTENPGGRTLYISTTADMTQEMTPLFRYTIDETPLQIFAMSESGETIDRIQ